MLVIDAIRENWLISLIPLIAAGIGYLTNVAAVYLMFHPIEFIGIKPYLGWQGVVPAAAVHLAKFSTHLIETKLLKLSDLFVNFKPEQFVGEVRPALAKIVDDILAETSQKHFPQMWATLDDKAKATIHQTISLEVEQVAIKILGDFSGRIEEIISLRRIVISTVERNKPLMNEMFLSVGREEFRFVRNSGFWFGLMFGVPQMIVWCLWPQWWTLPLAGIAVGYFTNFLALRMIFEPKRPIKVGPFVFHGLFHKRQQEVSTEFAKTTSEMVLYPKNMVDFITTGQSRETIDEILHNRFNELIEKYKQHPMAPMLLGKIGEDQIKQELFSRLDQELPREGGFLWIFVEKSVNVFSELSGRMKLLDPEEFEGVLRPAFQQDEWKLIALGAVLGGIAGWLQVVYMFGETLVEAGFNF